MNGVTIATVLFLSLLIASAALVQKLLKVEWRQGPLHVVAERNLGGLQEEDRADSLGSGNPAPPGKPGPGLGVVFERQPALTPARNEKLREEPAALGEEQPDRRAALTEILAEGGTEAEQALFSAALDPDPSIRELASETLAARNSQEDFQGFLRAATAEDPLTRLMALQVLSQHEPLALPVLAKALGDQDMEVKGYALQMLAQKRSPEALAVLGQVLHDPNPDFRQYALKFLSQLGDPTSLSYIGRALHDGDEAVRSLAADLVGSQ